MINDEKNTFPRIVADIGGTNARFALEISPYNYEFIKVLDCKEYSTVAAAVTAYLDDINMQNKVKHAAIAVPSPMVNDVLFMVNSPWHGQLMSETKKNLNIENIIFLNDFHALALSIPHIKQDNLIQCGGTEAPNPNKPIAIIGPGTGLGMATLIRHPLGDYLAIPAEGGRSSFAPTNEEELELWKFARSKFKHVSVERFLCGPGLQLIHKGLCHIHGEDTHATPTPAQITLRGINKTDSICTHTINIFCHMLGTVASNLATMVNAFGGVYIGGGIIPKMVDYFLHSEFRKNFEAKGRYHEHLAKIPVYIIMDTFAAFLGASYAIDTYINKGFIP